MNIHDEPREHISVSQLTAYLCCPLKYYFHYVEEIPWRTTPSAVAFGRTIHEAVKVMNESLMNGDPIVEEELIDTFTSRWTSQVEGNNIQWRTADECASLMTKGQGLLSLYYGKFHTFKPVSVELEFRLPILDPTSGLYIESRDVVGRIDSISEAGSIVEVKTSGKKPFQLDVDTNLQLTLYSWAYRMLYGVPEERIIVVTMMKTKEPQLEIMKTHRTERDYTRLFHLIERVTECIDHGLYYPNQMNIWGCRNCEYVVECEKQWPL